MSATFTAWLQTYAPFSPARQKARAELLRTPLPPHPTHPELRSLGFARPHRDILNLFTQQVRSGTDQKPQNAKPRAAPIGFREYLTLNVDGSRVLVLKDNVAFIKEGDGPTCLVCLLDGTTIEHEGSYESLSAQLVS